MSISKQDVEHIARLARIGISEDEIEKFQKDLGAILDYVKELEGVDTENVDPTSHIAGAENVMREDEINEKFKIPPEASLAKSGKNEKLIEMAPAKKGKYVKTKQILQ